MINGFIYYDFLLIKNKKNASKLYNSGFLGEFKGEKLKLSFIEACYLLESGVLVIKNKKDVQFLEFFKFASEKLEKFEILYTVYRDLKKRGYKIRVLNNVLEIEKDRNSRVIVADAYNFFDFDFLYDHLNQKDMILAVVDEELDITYFSLSAVQPSGNFSVTSLPIMTGKLLENTVVIYTSLDIPFGKVVENARYLSLLEVMYLNSRGSLTVETYDAASFEEYCKQKDPLFLLKYRVFEDLLNRGIFSKSGFKYGTEFRAYAKSFEEHAEYLVHIIFRKEKFEDLSRAVRLAHGVRKILILTSEKLNYISVRWIRP